jgi:murein DD-endopeptidase MepM/ murein hydrolase activator NlpD
MALLLAISAFWLASSPSFSQGKQHMEQNRKERDKYYSKIKELEGDKIVLSEVANQLDQKIGEYDDNLQSVRKQMAEAVKKRDEHKANSEKLEMELAERRDDLAARACVIYMQGDLNYVDLLFQSTDMNDFVDRMFFMQAIMENDQKTVIRTEESNARLQKEMASLEQQMIEIKNIEKSLEVALEKYEAERSSKEQSIRAIQSEQSLFLKYIREIEAENKRIAAELRGRKSTYGGQWSKDSRFVKPCAGKITSGFGYRTHPIYKSRRMHTGVDIGADKGTPIHAAGAGQVIAAKTFGGYGKCVMIDHGTDAHGRNVVTLYGHMSKITCNVGDKVSTKTKIGEVGSTGISTGNHLHFEVRINGDPVDPMKY